MPGPFIEQDPLYKMIMSDMGGAWPVSGPEPWNGSYTPWQATIKLFYCPADITPPATGIQHTNYLFCSGDSIDLHNTSYASRGLFGLNTSGSDIQA